MSKIISITLNPEDAAFDENINNHIIKQIKLKVISNPSQWKILKKSIDARKKMLKFNLKLKFMKMK